VTLRFEAVLFSGLFEKGSSIWFGTLWLQFLLQMQVGKQNFLQDVSSADKITFTAFSAFPNR